MVSACKTRSLNASWMGPSAGCYKLLAIMDEEKDSLRFYYLGNKYETRIEHFGSKAGYAPEGALII